MTGSPQADGLPDLGLNTDFWESLVELPAAFLEGYAYVAGTPSDSMTAPPPHTAFFVRALTADRFTFFNSNVDSGYSVDNLAPPAPLPFTASFTYSATYLHWPRSHAADFGEFRLHRGPNADFLPSPENLLIATRDTSFVDAPGAFHYKLAAIDIHGNSSRFAALAFDRPTGVLASLIGAESGADDIRLLWLSFSPWRDAIVYRRTAETAWVALDRVIADGGGFIRYRDASVQAGVRYGYRLEG